MLWTKSQRFHAWPFDKEHEVEDAIADVKADLLGDSRVYLEIKKLIGQPGKTQNIPDGYLLDLSSSIKPTLYLVEVELAKHDSLRHIAKQLLEFSLSFRSTPQKAKNILSQALHKDEAALTKCEQYAVANGFRNADYLLERMIYTDNADVAFNVLLIIDRLEDELEKILHFSLGFPVETLTIERFRSTGTEVVYHFEPFLYDISVQNAAKAVEPGNTPAIDPSEIDTIVVPAQEEGFVETFLGENMWRAVRIHASMIPKIHHVAAYQVSPRSAITYVAEVDHIEPWQDSGKYALYFKAPARQITPLQWVPGGKVTPLQNLRYTSLAKLQKAKTLDDVF